MLHKMELYLLYIVSTKSVLLKIFVIPVFKEPLFVGCKCSWPFFKERPWSSEVNKFYSTEFIQSRQLLLLCNVTYVTNVKYLMDYNSITIAKCNSSKTRKTQTHIFKIIKATRRHLCFMKIYYIRLYTFKRWYYTE